MRKPIKKNLFFYCFIAINILFIFLQIHKQNSYVKLSYEKQRLEKEKENLIQQKDYLAKKLFELKNLNNVKNIAIEKLKMENINLKQIKKINEINE